MIMAKYSGEVKTYQEKASSNIWFSTGGGRKSNKPETLSIGRSA